MSKKGNIDFSSKLRSIHKLFYYRGPKFLGELSYRHFMKGFPRSSSARGGGQTNSSRSGWKLRKGSPRHPALVKSGDLINSIKVRTGKGYSQVYTDLSYAEYQNNGAFRTGRGHNGRLPKREFIGKSSELDKKCKKEITKMLNSIFK